MALTLPYPGMDFTALDVLTASDMDKIVANIEYVAQRINYVKSGSTITITGSNLFAGIERTSNTEVWFSISTNLVTDSNRNFTVVPTSAYGFEVRDYSGIMFSKTSNTADYVTITGTLYTNGIMEVRARFLSSSYITLTNNAACVVGIKGTFTFA